MNTGWLGAGLLAAATAAAVAVAEDTVAESGGPWQLRGVLGESAPEAPKTTPKQAGHTGAVIGMALVSDAKRLVTAEANGKVVVWDLAGRKAVSAIQYPCLKTWILGLAVSPDGCSIALVRNNQVAVHDVETGKLLWRTGDAEAKMDGKDDPDEELADTNNRVLTDQSGGAGVHFIDNHRMLMADATGMQIREARSGKTLVEHAAIMNHAGFQHFHVSWPVVGFFDGQNLGFSEAFKGKHLGCIADTPLPEQDNVLVLYRAPIMRG